MRFAVFASLAGIVWQMWDPGARRPYLIDIRDDTAQNRRVRHPAPTSASPHRGSAVIAVGRRAALRRAALRCVVGQPSLRPRSRNLRRSSASRSSARGRVRAATGRAGGNRRAGAADARRAARGHRSRAGQESAEGTDCALASSTGRASTCCPTSGRAREGPRRGCRSDIEENLTETST